MYGGVSMLYDREDELEKDKKENLKKDNETSDKIPAKDECKSVMYHG